METWMWIVVAVVALALVGLVAWAAATRRRTETLRRQFGPEYEAVVSDAEDRRAAEAELEARRERREHLSLRPLSPESLERFALSWRELQARFVDAPAAAIQEADVLVCELMRERGYPTVDFEQQAADVSVDHPDVIRNYRAAHAISAEAAGGSVDTERMRRGIVYYRALFDELLEADGELENRRAG
jgi:hypothetical protein